MDCVSVCPNDALYFGFGKPTLLVPKSNAIKRNYSVTWPEEIVGAVVFLGSFLAVRGVYALVPFLMALGCATITTFLTLKTWRLFRANELSFYRFNLKSSGRIRKAGWAFRGLLGRLGWLECAQRMDPLSRISGRSRIPENSKSRTNSRLHRKTPPRGSARLIARTSTKEKNIFRRLRPSDSLQIARRCRSLPGLNTSRGDAERSVALLGQAAARQKGQGQSLKPVLSRDDPQSFGALRAGTAESR